MKVDGLTVNFLGDSITEGKGLLDKKDRYDNVVGRMLNIGKVNNYGIGGTRIAHQFAPSKKARWDLNFCGRAWDMDKTADVIVIYGGINDCLSGDAPFGKIGDSERTTFCGAVEHLCQIIDYFWPNATKIFITPAKCGRDKDPLEYVNAIDTIASKHNFHILRLYEELKIDPRIKEDSEKYTVDGLHFNENGHLEIAKVLAKFIQKI